MSLAEGKQEDCAPINPWISLASCDPNANANKEGMISPVPPIKQEEDENSMPSLQPHARCFDDGSSAEDDTPKTCAGAAKNFSS